MSLKEYEPGTAFPGAMGRTIQESEPACLAHGRGAPGRAQLYVDGTLAGQTDLPVTIPLDIGITDGLTVGRDEGSSVTTDYGAPFAFTGKLEQIAVDVSGELIGDTTAQMKSIMAHQ